MKVTGHARVRLGFINGRPLAPDTMCATTISINGHVVAGPGGPEWIAPVAGDHIKIETPCGRLEFVQLTDVLFCDSFIELRGYGTYDGAYNAMGFMGEMSPNAFGESTFYVKEDLVETSLFDHPISFASTRYCCLCT